MHIPRSNIVSTEKPQDKQNLPLPFSFFFNFENTSQGEKQTVFGRGSDLFDQTRVYTSTLQQSKGIQTWQTTELTAIASR